MMGVSELNEERVVRHARTIKIDGNGLSWAYGTLQYPESANGPWMDLPATSPIPLAPAGEMGFFQIKVEG